MAVSEWLKKQHFFLRAGFGPLSVNDLRQGHSINNLYKSFIKTSAGCPQTIDVSADLYPQFYGPLNEPGSAAKAGVFNASEIKERARIFRKESTLRIRQLNLKWMDEMVTSPAQLREKTALFWHGHFACLNQNVVFQQALLQVIRSNALGSFRTLLTEVSKSAAMLAFLNNQQNRKSHPNENFARELMELFTLGRGNYNEKDVQEAARAFTGWGFNAKGEFVIKKLQHDTGAKTFLGSTGHFNGDDVINIILKQEKCAAFICRKVYKFFVNEQPDEVRVQWLANRFYHSDYNIGALLHDIFTSDWFYDKKNIGNKIKSPVELLVGIRRMLPMQIEKSYTQLLLQRALGQVLFYPPNVAGWPGGKNWINSSSLMLRLRIPRFFNGSDALTIIPKSDDDQEMGMEEMAVSKVNKKLEAGISNRFSPGATIDWLTYTEQFKNVQRPQLLQAIVSFVIQGGDGSFNIAAIEASADKTSREKFIKSASIALMSTPDFQLS